MESTFAIVIIEILNSLNYLQIFIHKKVLKYVNKDTKSKRTEISFYKPHKMHKDF